VREVARRAGVDSAVISRVEHASVDAQLTTLLLIAEALEVDLSVLVAELPPRE
jgi:transcriptional regulator with XRE-family HTH domain